MTCLIGLVSYWCDCTFCYFSNLCCLYLKLKLISQFNSLKKGYKEGVGQYKGTRASLEEKVLTSWWMLCSRWVLHLLSVHHKKMHERIVHRAVDEYFHSLLDFYFWDIDPLEFGSISTYLVIVPLSWKFWNNDISLVNTSSIILFPIMLKSRKIM